jgi:thioredoxin reductase/NAD-dependent dihydropyrimidine dehydrogenase PreA subunit
MTDTLIIVAVGMVLVLLFVLPYIYKQRKLELATAEAQKHAHHYGLHEPVSIHPVIDPNVCICAGSCVAVCPEHVLGIQDGKTVTVAAANCVGHGLCERSCPVDAIRLVFGSERRGLELPRLRENFETNVLGMFIIGELGGMGLIRNAFEQAKQCIDGIARTRTNKTKVQDLVIVGCGPAGLAAALHASHRGLSYTLVEREDVGGTVRHYPRKKIVMTEPVKVPGYGKLDFREIRKEELMEIWYDIIAKNDIRVQTGELVENVVRLDGTGFRVSTPRTSYEAERVILAIGRRGVPRKLGVPGESSPHVAYALREPEEYCGDDILIVGCGDSAVEAALSLAEQPGTTVTISYRGETFSRLKEKNRAAVGEAISSGRIKALLRSQVSSITPDSVTLFVEDRMIEMRATRVFVFIGGALPTPFLKQCGVEIDVKFGTP